MDKRRNKRVVLVTGLLFLLILTTGLLYVNAERVLYREKVAVLGRMLDAGSSEGDKAAAVFHDFDGYERGRETAEKYGYKDNRHLSWRLTLQILWLPLFSGTAALAVMLLLLLTYRKRLKEEQLLRFEAEDKVTQLEGEKEVLLRRIEQEEAKSKALVTDISHQLKTPLASLKMCYEIADTSDFSRDEQLEFLMQGKNEVEKLENLTQSLIQLSRLEAHMIQIHRERAGLKATLLGAVNNIYMKAFEKGVEISVDEFEDGNVFHDVRWTQEAFVNVLDNAVKYSPANSHIHIRVTRLSSIYLLEVEDEGAGVKTEEANQIFKRFYRGSAARICGTEGSGVGLYLTRKILEE